MTREETEKLIARYLDGETTVEEEKRLALEVTRPDAPQEWRVIAAMIGELATDEALFDHIMKRRAGHVAVRKRSHRAWWAAAACLLLVAGISLTRMLGNEEREETPLMAEVKPDEKESVAITDTLTVTKEVTAQSAPEVEDKPSDTVKTPGKRSMVGTQTNVYACGETDTYQDPNLLTQFIGELAKRYQADSLHLDCPTTEDKHSLATVYVFSDNKEQDIVGKLVQAACWYDNATPGYRLSLTNDQFILEMRDSRRNMRCLWMAERVRGQILLHCVRATGNAPIFSSCYKDFRETFAEKYRLL